MEGLDFLVMAAQMILSLSLLIGIHEFGHMIAAKMFGMRVEQFSIGFPPKIWKKKIGETEYSIGAILLGGFVKISGMIDESLDTEKMKEEPKPWEFRAKPAWQRMIVMLGGIIMNVITGVVIFVVLAYKDGETYISKEELNKNGIVAYELGQKIGFETGDRVTLVNGADYDKFSDLFNPDVFLSEDGYYTVDRSGAEVRIDIPSNFIEAFSDRDENVRFIDAQSPFEVDRVQPNTGAKKAGLQAGDKITSVDGVPINYFHELQFTLDSLQGKVVMLELLRGEERLNTEAQVSVEGKLGFYPRLLIDLTEVDYTFGESIEKGTATAFGAVWLNIKAFGKMFRGELDPTKSLRGPIGIAKEYGTTWDWGRFWRLTGLISMVLAFMNLLPIPALDGGHVMFLSFEMLSGRKPSDKVVEVAQKAGMAFLLGLMVLIFANDIIGLF